MLNVRMPGHILLAALSWQWPASDDASRSMHVSNIEFPRNDQWRFRANGELFEGMGTRISPLVRKKAPG
jgi:hypothetical protein